MLGQKSLTTYVLIWLETKKKVNIVFSVKAKTHIPNALPKLKLFSSLNVVSNKKLKLSRKLKRANQNHVKAVRLQEKLGKQNFHEDMKKVVQPVTVTIKKAPEDLTKTMMLTFKEKNKTVENINDSFFRNNES